MKLIRPSFEILDSLNYPRIVESLVTAGRTCYKSEVAFTLDEGEDFLRKRIATGHESIIEHEKITVRIICDRGVTHEIVRHRIASFSQESTRYCNYKGGVTFIIPPWVDIVPGEYASVIPHLKDDDFLWMLICCKSEETYRELLRLGWNPQQARSILPNSLKTEIIVTMNMREWRHFFKLRTSKAAHPQMREIARPMLLSFRKELPCLFEDLNE